MTPTVGPALSGLVLALAGAGCAAVPERMYAGPPLPAEAVAKLEVEMVFAKAFSFAGPFHVDSVALDGRACALVSAHRRVPMWSGGPRHLMEILPGSHDLEVGWREHSIVHDTPQMGLLPRLVAATPSHLGGKTLSFVAEAGHRYVARGVFTDGAYPGEPSLGGKYSLQIFDEADPARPIAGGPPPPGP